MTLLPGKPASFWIDSTPETNFPSISRGLLVDVAILGGGMVGLTAATLLKRAGQTVAVIEAEQIVKGVTGHTTAKVTSLHRLIYAELLKKFGEEKARLYAESNQAAIERIAAFIEEEQIDCDFERKSAYTYTESASDMDAIEAEVNAALQLGLPASFVRETSLPFPIQGAVRFDNQAQFHPRKYLLALAKTIPGNGSYLFEETRALDVKEGNPCEVMTDKGVIMARDVIVATNLPILDKGLFFAKAYPKRSYVLSARIDPSKAPVGMFINTENPSHSIRTTPYEGGLLLIVNGEEHKTGHISDTENRYKKLEEYARDRFEIDSFEYHWSTQDYTSVDKVPYIGKLTPASKHVYVASGFGGWGMTNGTLSGMILKDLILERPNPWTKLYDATRATSFVSKKFFQENADVAQDWLKDRFTSPQAKSFSEVANGEGKIVTINGEKVAAYRDEQGIMHALSPVCTHLKCLVHWNNAEKSWDCPCHGSRFSYEGKVLHGPAVKDLEQKRSE
jgi:glycine/D-amino acid oxidase-like deaminating enzyme/nitrite reductase/ring-hydroxylating ferredoxin subunit